MTLKTSGRKLEEVERIVAHEVPAGIPMAQWALPGALKPGRKRGDPGSKSPEQLEMNVKAVDLL